MRAYYLACFCLIGAHLSLADPSDRVLDLPFDSSNSSQSELCWERCLQVDDTDYERFREVYQDFYQIGVETRKLKNLNGVNGTAMLIDSTLAAFHSSRPNLDADDKAQAIWQFQLDLTAIIAFLTGADNDHNPFYLLQFNEESAYTCDEFQCLDACEVDSLLQPATFQIQTGINSHKRGNVEAACALAKREMDAVDCSNSSLANQMAISTLNSDIWSLMIKAEEAKVEEEVTEIPAYSPCLDHFKTRFAVGTHAASWDSINSFGDANGAYVHDNEYTMAAARALRSCLSSRCCPTGTAYTWWRQDIAGSTCKITVGSHGESETVFTGYGNGP